MTGIFDTHAHYDDTAFDGDRDSLLSSMAAGGVAAICNAGSTLASSRTSLELAERYDFIYAAVGIHPDEIGELNEETFAELCRLAAHPKAVAVGEIGLDYYVPDFLREDPDYVDDKDQAGREKQQYWFIRQLELARQLGKPVVIHSRDAAKDTMDLIRDKADGLTLDIHCYSYSPEQARAYLDMGHYLGIGGVLTFKNSRKLKEVVAMMPEERILLETDCPYLAPVPFRGKRNSSLNLPYVVKAIAELKGMSEGRVLAVTWDNACRFYGLPH